MNIFIINLKKNNAIICGTGFRRANAKVFKKPTKIIAARRPLSRNKFLKHKIECQEVYGKHNALYPEKIR